MHSAGKSSNPLHRVSHGRGAFLEISVFPLCRAVRFANLHVTTGYEKGDLDCHFPIQLQRTAGARARTGPVSFAASVRKGDCIALPLAGQTYLTASRAVSAGNNALIFRLVRYDRPHHPDLN